MPITRDVIYKATLDASGMEKGSAKGKKAVNSLSKEATKTGSVLKNLAGSLAAAFSVGTIVAGVQRAVKSFQTYEKGLRSLQGILGATEEQLNFFKEASQELARETTQSAAEVVEAFKLVGSAKPELLENQEALKAVTQEVITLAEASGLDLATATDALTGSLNQFGLGAEDASRFINVLAAGAKEGAAAIPELAQTVKVAGTVAASSGTSFETLIGLTETLAERQLKGAEAGTQLRNIFAILQSQNIGYASGVFNINDALDELAEKNLDVAQLTKLFGRESFTAAQILIEQRGRVEELTGAVTGTQEAYKQAAINNDTLDASLTKLSNSVDLAFIAIGEQLAPAIKDTAVLVEGLAGSTEQAAQSMSDYAEENRGSILVLEGLATAIGGIVSLTNELRETLGISLSEINKFTSFAGIAEIGINKWAIAISDLIGFIDNAIEKISFFSQSNGELAQNLPTIQQSLGQVGLNFAFLADQTGNTTGAVDAANQSLNDFVQGAISASKASKQAAESNKELAESAAEVELYSKGQTDAIDELSDSINTIDLKPDFANDVNFQLFDVEKRARRTGIAVDEMANDVNASLDKLAASEKLEGFLEGLQKVQAGLQIISQGVDLIDQAFQVKFDNELARIDEEEQRRLESFTGTTQEREKLEAECAAKREEIEKEQARKAKAIAIIESIINTALAVTAAIAANPVPPFPFAIAAGIFGAAQTAIIAAQQFKEGGYTGNAGVNDVAGIVHGREFVMDATATKQYRPVLEAMHARKKPSEVMNVLKRTNNIFDDRRLLKGIESQTNSLVMEFRKNKVSQRGTYYRRVRNA